MNSTLVVNEIFFSIQGEGPYSGYPCTFIRTTGCPMRCTYCDTSYAFYDGTPMSLEQIQGRVNRFSCNLIQITGGEPLAQRVPVIELMEQLLQQKKTVLLETGGRFSIKGIPDPVVKILDVKSPESGEHQNMTWDFLGEEIPNTYLKFVLCSESDYAWAHSWLKKHEAEIAPYPVYFSAASGFLEPTTLADRILADALNVRFQIQLHKSLWGNRPGV